MLLNKLSVRPLNSSSPPKPGIGGAFNFSTGLGDLLLLLGGGRSSKSSCDTDIGEPGEDFLKSISGVVFSWVASLIGVGVLSPEGSSFI